MAVTKELFHASVEGAQHGAKSLEDFLAFAKSSGAAGAQPSNYLLEADGGFKSAADIKAAFEAAELKLDGISGHCPFWVHTTAWTGSPTIKPFLSPEVAAKSSDEIEAWAEDYLLRLMDLCAELKIFVLPMFWGVAHGWEAAGGYPWGFWDTILSRKATIALLRRPRSSAVTPISLASSWLMKFIRARWR
jgi:hypothetical protein